MKLPVYANSILRDLLSGPVLLSSIRGPKYPVDTVTKLRKDILPSGRDIVGKKVKVKTKFGVIDDMLYELVRVS